MREVLIPMAVIFAALTLFAWLVGGSAGLVGGLLAAVEGIGLTALMAWMDGG